VRIFFNRGKGWVCEDNDRIVGFGIVDMKEKHLGFLFILNLKIKESEKTYDTMLNWYFDQTNEKIWLELLRIQEQRYSTENPDGQKTEFTERMK
jgi:hypothetical protein